MLLTASHVILSSSFASVIVIVELFPAFELIILLLRNHEMVTGGVPVTMLQSIVTSDPLKICTFEMLDNFWISGGTPDKCTQTSIIQYNYVDT